MLVSGWGSTYGAIRAGMRRAQRRGIRVAVAHLRHINPFPANLGEVLAQLPKVLIPELNSGQLLRLIRAEFLVDAVGLNKVAGVPFQVTEIERQDHGDG